MNENNIFNRNRLGFFGILIPFLLFIFLSSCRSGNGGGLINSIFSNEIDTDKFKEAIEKDSLLKSDDTTNLLVKAINELYQDNGYKPLWMDGYKISEKGKKAIKAIHDLEFDGLNPEHYQLQQLQKDSSSSKDNEEFAINFELLLTYNIAKASKDLLFGIIKPKDVDQEWHIPNDSNFTLKSILSLDSLNDKNIFDSFRPENPRYALMRKEIKKWIELKSDSDYISIKEQLKSGDSNIISSVIHKEIYNSASDTDLIKSYQYLNHLSTTGKINDELFQILSRSPDYYIDLLKINMERLRWIHQEFDSQYIWVSIPQAEVDYYKDGKNLFHNRAVVGAKSTRTPSIFHPLENIVFCPPWGVPLSIVKNEYGGRIPSKYEVFKGGKRVPNSMVNASNYRQFSVRQPPGPAAALGYVKFNLPNKWDIYLHDTPGRYVFGNKLRYISHGCVRIKNPRDLAALILEDKGIGIDSINTMIRKNKTKFINTDKINVYLVYTTTNSDSTNNNILYLNDPYKKDAILKEQFVAALRYNINIAQSKQ
ncbi:MAG TPA: L,D-transpeptidase family protein [Edaphocola sp.]|nr:L,D-transpeptidase family protein [Edaphocola sp.]